MIENPLLESSLGNTLPSLPAFCLVLFMPPYYISFLSSHAVVFHFSPLFTFYNRYISLFFIPTALLVLLLPLFPRKSFSTPFLPIFLLHIDSFLHTSTTTLLFPLYFPIPSLMASSSRYKPPQPKPSLQTDGQALETVLEDLSLLHSARGAVNVTLLSVEAVQEAATLLVGKIWSVKPFNRIGIREAIFKSWSL